MSLGDRDDLEDMGVPPLGETAHSLHEIASSGSYRHGDLRSQSISPSASHDRLAVAAAIEDDDEDVRIVRAMFNANQSKRAFSGARAYQRRARERPAERCAFANGGKRSFLRFFFTSKH